MSINPSTNWFNPTSHRSSVRDQRQRICASLSRIIYYLAKCLWPSAVKKKTQKHALSLSLLQTRESPNITIRASTNQMHGHMFYKKPYNCHGEGSCDCIPPKSFWCDYTNSPLCTLKL